MAVDRREAQDIVSLWIKSHQTLKSHPKMLRLTKLLGIKAPQAIGHLHCLWWWAVDYAKDGDLSAFDEIDIAIAAEWDGDPGKLLNALLDCGPGGSAGFLERDGDSILIHDWGEYAGRLIAQKEERKVKATDRKATSCSSEDIERWWNSFWDNYPRHVDKKRARAAFDSIIADAPAPKRRDRMEKISLRLAKYCDSCVGSEERYIKHPATWLRAYEWDEPLEPGETLQVDTFDLEPKGDFGSLRDENV